VKRGALWCLLKGRNEDERMFTREGPKWLKGVGGGGGDIEWQ